jgi:hypothetical protein
MQQYKKSDDGKSSLCGRIQREWRLVEAIYEEAWTKTIPEL